MKRKGKMSSALLLRLLVGLVIPFTACLLFIAMQTYTDVQEDKAQAYATLIEVVTQNMDATLGQFGETVEITAQNDAIGSMGYIAGEKHLNSVVEKSEGVWSHFIMIDKTGKVVANTLGADYRDGSALEEVYFKESWEQEKRCIANP